MVLLSYCNRQWILYIHTWWQSLSSLACVDVTDNWACSRTPCGCSHTHTVWRISLKMSSRGRWQLLSSTLPWMLCTCDYIGTLSRRHTTRQEAEAGALAPPSGTQSCDSSQEPLYAGLAQDAECQLLDQSREAPTVEPSLKRRNSNPFLEWGKTPASLPGSKTC